MKNEDQYPNFLILYDLKEQPTVKDEKKSVYYNIMSIYNWRHKKSEIILAIIYTLMLIFSILIPICIVYINNMTLLYLILFCIPSVLIVFMILYIRKMIIIKHVFLKTKNVSEKIEYIDIYSREYFKDEEVFIFKYTTDLIILFLYNWFNSLNTLKNEKLTLYRFKFKESDVIYIGIKTNDLNINETNKSQFLFETKDCVLLKNIKTEFEEKRTL